VAAVRSAAAARRASGERAQAMVSGREAALRAANASIASSRHWIWMENDPKLNPGGDGESIEVTDASGGQKTGHIRWVLRIGTALAVVGVLIIWLLSHH
jgi:hypothetical protein